MQKKVPTCCISALIELTICENLDLELESREQDKRYNFMHETHINTKSLN